MRHPPGTAYRVCYNASAVAAGVARGQVWAMADRGRGRIPEAAIPIDLYRKHGGLFLAVRRANRPNRSRDPGAIAGSFADPDCHGVTVTGFTEF
jgi:hypothetical protein